MGMKDSKNRRRNCPLCDDTFGMDRSLITHLRKSHGLVGESQDLYDKLVLDGRRSTCECGCGSNVKWSGWCDGYSRFANGHNAFFENMPQVKADSIRKKRLETKRKNGKPNWNVGLSKETDERVAEGARKRSETSKRQFESGERISWIKGLTKESDDRVARMSESLRESYASGSLVPWAKGLTKESDDRVARMSASVRDRHSERQLREHLDSIKRLSHDEIRRRLDESVTNLKLLSNLHQYTRDRHDNLIFQCLCCGDKRERSLLSALTNRCFVCNPTESKGQLKINDFIRSLELPTVLSNRNVIPPYELDIWVPSKSLAVEFNGLYWHSETMQPDRNYHSRKTQMCSDVGIHLIHIFEDEWKDKRDIVMSIIRHKLGKSVSIVGARKCEIRRVSPDERRSFFNRTHIDGDSPAKVAFGLYSGDELVSCLSLRKPRQKKYSKHIGIARFSSELNTSVPGALSRLLKSAQAWATASGYEKILTYVDTRHGDGKGYVRAGFKKVGVTVNRFWWTDDVYRYNRFMYRACDGMSQREVAKRAGVKMIWGCPNLILEIAC